MNLDELTAQLTEHFRVHASGPYGDLCLTPERAAGIAADVFGSEVKQQAAVIEQVRAALSAARTGVTVADRRRVVLASDIERALAGPAGAPTRLVLDGAENPHVRSQVPATTPQKTVSDSSPIEDLGLSVRISSCLRREDSIRTVGDLASRTPESLLDLRTFGHGSLAEVVDRLRAHGRQLLPSEIPPPDGGA